MNSRVHQGHFARKRFGQNFLNDPYISKVLSTPSTRKKVKWSLRSALVLLL